MTLSSSWYLSSWNPGSVATVFLCSSVRTCVYRSLNAIAAQYQNRPFGLNTTIELQNVITTRDNTCTLLVATYRVRWRLCRFSTLRFTAGIVVSTFPLTHFSIFDVCRSCIQWAVCRSSSSDRPHTPACKSFVNHPAIERHQVLSVSASENKAILSCLRRSVVDCVWNVMAHAQKPDFVFQRNGRVHLNRQGPQFSRLLAAEMCASAVVMLDTPSSEVVKGTDYPLHSPVSPSLPLPCVTVCHHISTGLYYCAQLTDQRAAEVLLG